MATSAGTTRPEVDDLDGVALREAISDASRESLASARDRYVLAHQWCVTHPPADPDEDAATWGDVRLPGLGSACDARVGGEGTPGVRRFAVEEYAATAGLSAGAAAQVLSDALDLHHRYRRTWARVVALQVPAWVAARIAADTSHLSQNAANWIDQQLDATGRYTWRAIDFTMKQAIASFHPDLLVRPERGREDWDVRVDHDAHAEGTSRLEALGDSLDLEKFHQLIRDEAATLGRLGDPDTLGQRKAKALGVIADRHATHQDALDLGAPASGTGPAVSEEQNKPATCDRQRATDPRTRRSEGRSPWSGPRSGPEDSAPDHTWEQVLAAMHAAEQAAVNDASAASASDKAEPTSVPGSNAGLSARVAEAAAAAGAAHDAAAAARTASVTAGFGDPVHPGSEEPVTKVRSYVRPTIYVHIGLADLVHTKDKESVVVDVGQLGPQLLSRVQDWLAACGSDARITGVVDLRREWSVDQHDPPAVMAKQIELRDQHCTFPHCTVPAQRCDHDHIEPYDPAGPPGQTSPDNLACLCRGHHRLKTFTGWTYDRDPDGNYLWTSPHRQRWRVTPGRGTTRLQKE